ncbi:hypothetical protein ABKV19_017445, partial [Rosa sericea]
MRAVSKLYEVCVQGDAKSYDRAHRQTEAGFLLPTFQSPMAANNIPMGLNKEQEEGDAFENKRKKDKKKLEVEKSTKMLASAIIW